MSWESSSSSDPLPSAIETRADLARELTALRTRAGLTVRALSSRLDMPAATIGDYCSGRHLPGLSQHDAFSSMLRVCGVPDTELPAWLDALSRVRRASDRRVGRVNAPYRGLEPFEPTDSELFFGREAVTEELLERLRRLRDRMEPAAHGAVTMIVLGASGSGKSSVLRAGVAAGISRGALDTPRASWSAQVLVPGDAPCDALRAAANDCDDQPQLIIVDQLEEIFRAPDTERTRFLESLRELRERGSLVIAGLRADFYEAALAEPLLLDALAHGQVPLGPMSEDEIRRAVTEPARHVGAHVEPGLQELLITDLGLNGSADALQATGVLPLLSHALLATWNRGHGNELTIADYRASGQLRGAVAQSAEQLYGELNPKQRQRARQIFCRLVSITGDGPLTRRRVPHDELDELDLDSASVLERFVDGRLITADAETVALSHEALLSAWPRLAQWIEQDRDSLRLHQQLSDAARAWDTAGRDPSLLLRGLRLQATLDWSHDLGGLPLLTRVDREFLDASRALAQSERDAARRRTRHTRQLLAAVAVFAVGAAALAGLAFHARHAAQQARDQALSRQVAIEATTLRPSDPALAMQLALAAYRLAPTLQATSTLLQGSAGEFPTRILGVDGPTSEALSANGRELAVAASATDTVRLYDLSEAALPARRADVSPDIPGQALYAEALSPNGQILAAGGTSGKITLWSLSSLSHPVRLTTLGGFTSTVYSVTFTSDGRRLAAADNDGTVRQWSLADPAAPKLLDTLVAPKRQPIQSLAYSPDGRLLTAAGGPSGGAGLVVTWGLSGGAARMIGTTFTPRTMTSIAYSPDGGVLAAGSQNGLVYLWRTKRSGHLAIDHQPLHGFTNWVNSLAFSHSGGYLAAGSSDSSVRIWSTASWKHVATLRHPAQVTGTLFTPDGRHLITVDEDGTARIWSFPPPAAIREPGGVFTVDYSSDGKLLAAVSGGTNTSDVDLWSSADPWRPKHLAAVKIGGSFGPAYAVEALSLSGRLLAVGDQHGIVQLVDLVDPHHPQPIGIPLTGATPTVQQLNFNPQATLLSVAEYSGRIHLWDIAHPAHPTRLATIDPDGKAAPVNGVDYSPDGRLLAAASSDDKVRLWDVSDPRRPRLLTVLAGFKSSAETVAFTPDGRTLIAGSADDTIRLWNITDPVHPKLLGAALTGATSAVYDIAVSSNGTALAAATTGGDVLLWNIREPSHPVLVASLTASAEALYDVTFSPNQSTLVAAGAARTLNFWNYHPSQVARRICKLAGTPITRSEWAQYIQGADYEPPCKNLMLTNP